MFASSLTNFFLTRLSSAAGVPLQNVKESPFRDDGNSEAHEPSLDPGDASLDGWSEDLPTPMRTIQQEFQTALVETVGPDNSLYCLPARRALP